MRILIVEDEAPIREVMKKYLQLAGFEVDEAASGEVAIVKFKNNFDLVILDLNLPNADGLEVCRQIRSKSHVPIIVVTARTEEIDELKGLQIGADDYMKKPFSPKVLVARVQAMFRRAQSGNCTRNKLTLHPERMEVSRLGKKVDLTLTQFKILETLMQKPGRIYSRQELMRAAHEKDAAKASSDRTVDAHIKAIRKAIGDDPHQPRFIRTIVGAGYAYQDEA
jgi:DNA-binding response OmpR family regulator